MKQILLLFFSFFCLTTHASLVREKSILENAQRSSLIILVEIINVDDTIITGLIHEQLKGKIALDTIRYKIPKGKGSPLLHRGSSYKIGQKELAFLINWGNKWMTNSELVYHNDSLTVLPTGFEHGSFYKVYRENSTEKKYSYTDLKSALDYFLNKSKKLEKRLLKESSLIQIKEKQGGSYYWDEGPEIIIQNKKLIKLIKKSTAHKRLLDEMIDNILISNW
tara:strand:+ start:67 stop:732 length:666 start_codon:yes stop_codon:yes gene_type:complete